MTEGRYTWLWQPSGAPTNATASDSALTGVRIVRSLQRVTNAYPGR
jgi:hypothetical protein